MKRLIQILVIIAAIAFVMLYWPCDCGDMMNVDSGREGR